MKTIGMAAALVGLMLTGGAATAQTVATSTKTTTTTTKPAAIKKTATVKSQADTSVTAAGNGHMVTTKTSSGKSITYDCSKAGNRTKAVCKG